MVNNRLLSGDKGFRAYSGIPTFLRSKSVRELDNFKADYAVVGVPYDEGSPFIGGSRFCARSLREHSLRFGGGALFDIDANKEYLRDSISKDRLVDIGDIDISPSRGDKSMEKLTKTIEILLEKKVLPIVLGGDHTLTFPTVRAYKKPIHVIQLDAHMDYSEPTEGMKYVNSTSFRLLHQLENVKSLTQIGTRSMRDEKSNVDHARTNGSNIISVNKARKQGIESLLNGLNKGEDCYVSIDVDAYDMSLVPGCVSAEPGGFQFEEIKRIIKNISERMNVISFDFVEVNPPLDVGTRTTSYLGALTVAMFLGFIDAKKFNY